MVFLGRECSIRYQNVMYIFFISLARPLHDESTFFVNYYKHIVPSLKLSVKSSPWHLDHSRINRVSLDISHQGPQALNPPTLAAPDSTSHFPIFPSEQKGCLKLTPRTYSIHSLPSTTSPSANSGNCRRRLFSVASNCPATERARFVFSLDAASCTSSQVFSRAERWAW